MRVGATGIIIVALALVGGCQKKQQLPSATAMRQQADLRYDDSGHGAALAIDPPATMGNPKLNLARAGRERSIFMGFESSTMTVSWVRMDDRQTDDPRNDRLERRAVSEQVKTSYR